MKRAGKKTSARETPTISIAYMLYVTAYLVLDAEREYLKPIPFSAKVQYCSFYELTQEQSEWLMDITRAVDNAVLVDREAEVKRKQGHGSNPTKSSAGNGRVRARR